MRCARTCPARSPTKPASISSTATRGLKLNDEHIALSHAFVEKFPNSPFAEEILNNLASAYIIDDQDDEADKVFREILDRYPAGRFAERAAWKAGWWAYRQGQFLDALQYFDRGAAQFPALRLSARRGCIGRPAPRSRPATSRPASRACA